MLPSLACKQLTLNFPNGVTPMSTYLISELVGRLGRHGDSPEVWSRWYWNRISEGTVNDTPNITLARLTSYRTSERVVCAQTNIRSLAISRRRPGSTEPEGLCSHGKTTHAPLLVTSIGTSN